MIKLWRVAAIGLLIANAVVLGLRALQPPPTPPPRPQPAPVDAPRVALVPEGSTRPAADGPRCYTIGPLATLVQQSRAEDRLRPFVNRMRVRTTMADRDRGWWVFVAASSRPAAIELARELAAEGVEDYFVVADEDLPEAVSLGLYEKLDNARRRMNRTRQLGFDAQLSVRREEAPQFWIDYEIEPGERSPWRFILRASPGAVNFEIPCF